MSEVIEKGALFELELDLPKDKIAAATKRLVGFENRYQRLHRDLRLLADPQELADWSKKFHHKELAICAAVSDRYPLVIFAGDVGTGKTATAEGACDRLAREARKEAMLFKLSTRVRGSGKVGQMSSLLNEAFDVVAKQAGKTRQAFLIIDEADSLAATRGSNRRIRPTQRAGAGRIIPYGSRGIEHQGRDDSRAGAAYGRKGRTAGF